VFKRKCAVSVGVVPAGDYGELADDGDCARVARVGGVIDE
jgi:hypothetical protein